MTTLMRDDPEMAKAYSAWHESNQYRPGNSVAAFEAGYNAGEAKGFARGSGDEGEYQRKIAALSHDLEKVQTELDEAMLMWRPMVMQDGDGPDV